MKSAAFLSAALRSAKNSIDCVPLSTMRGACTREDRIALQQCVYQFFTRPAVLQSTPSSQDAKDARVLKSSNEIAKAWQEIMDRRRLVEPNDRCPITVQATLTRMYNTWMHEWLEENLTRAQQQLAERKQTSMLSAYLSYNFGGKQRVMALWETGIQKTFLEHVVVNDDD